MAEDERQDTPQDETTPEPAAEQPPAEEEAAPEQPAAESREQEPAAEQQAEAEPEPAAEQAPAAEGETAAEPEPAAEQPLRPKPKRDRKKGGDEEPDVIPGAHLEPDLVLEEEARERDELAAYAEYGAPEDDAEAEGEAGEEAAGEPEEEAAPLSAVLDLAADARYRATGKRKSAVARVTLKPGTGRYTVNGKNLDEYFPRVTLQTQVRRPLETVAQQDRMDVVAKIHGGGVSAQAGALRHGITRALVEADPNLRGELKRRGFLTRDPRVKERKKAGLKKARKRPQFSKR